MFPFVDLLFPPRCVNCDADLSEGSDGLQLCADCRLMLGPRIWPCCPACGAAGKPAGRCPWCRKARLKFDAVIPLGSYNQGLDRVVIRMKRPVHHSLSMAMGRLLTQRRWPRLVDFGADVIVPIPMFWARRLIRGTNSPEILAACLGRHLRLPVRRLLVRRRNTPPQVGLSPTARFQNVRGAFAVRRRQIRRSRDVRVLLVDDTLTTGATCSEAAAMLKRVGASAVACAVIARAQGPGAT